MRKQRRHCEERSNLFFTVFKRKKCKEEFAENFLVPFTLFPVPTMDCFVPRNDGLTSSYLLIHSFTYLLLYSH